MEAEIGKEIGAGLGEISAERVTHRNGYRPRLWETRVGEIELAVPRKRDGSSYFPSFLEPRRPCEQAIVACVMEAYVNGVSTRKVDRLVEQLGIRLGEVLERFRDPLPRIAELLETAEEDLLAFYQFPHAHWPKLRSTNPLERVNREIGRRTDVVGIFPNDASALRLAGALLIEQNDQWLVNRRYLSAESITLILNHQNEHEEREELAELKPG